MYRYLNAQKKTRNCCESEKQNEKIMLEEFIQSTTEKGTDDFLVKEQYGTSYYKKMWDQSITPRKNTQNTNPEPKGTDSRKCLTTF